MDFGLVSRMEFLILAFVSLSMMTLGSLDAMNGGGLLRRLAVRALPYIISATPVGFLVYMLYVVSRMA